LRHLRGEERRAAVAAVAAVAVAKAGWGFVGAHCECGSAASWGCCWCLCRPAAAGRSATGAKEGLNGAAGPARCRVWWGAPGRRQGSRSCRAGTASSAAAAPRRRSSRRPRWAGQQAPSS
jgi:hypothetical protein